MTEPDVRETGHARTCECPKCWYERAMAEPPRRGLVMLTGAVTSIDAQCYPEDRAKLGIRDAGGGYSLIAVPREFARTLSLGSAVSITVLAIKEEPRDA
jgi:hypothetical protein